MLCILSYDTQYIKKGLLKIRNKSQRKVTAGFELMRKQKFRSSVVKMYKLWLDKALKSHFHETFCLSNYLCG